MWCFALTKNAKIFHVTVKKFTTDPPVEKLTRDSTQFSLVTAEWVFGSRSANRRTKSDVNCITAGGSEMNELPRLLQPNYVTHNHSGCSSGVKPEELVVNIDEPLHLPLSPPPPSPPHTGT